MMKKKKIKNILITSFVFACSIAEILSARTYAPYTGEFAKEAACKSVPFEIVEQRIVCPGMEYLKFSSADPLVIGCALIVDPTKIYLESVHSRWLTRLEKVSEMAKRKNALAAVNGGFYRPSRHFCSNPAGVLKINDLFYSDPQFSRGALAWNKNGQIYLGRLKVNWYLNIGSKQYRVDRVNQPRGDGEAIVYNSAFRNKTFTNRLGVEIVVRNGIVNKITVNQGNAKIPDDGFVYSIDPQAGIDTKAISLGSKVKLSYSLSLFDAPSKSFETKNQSFDFIVGGGPMMLASGETRLFEDMDAEIISGKALVKRHPGDSVGDYHDASRHRHWLIEKRHPRTAVGQRSDNKLVFIVVDGRIPGYSIGVNLYEVADIMKRFGCQDAINLDGGGASILYLERAIKNMLAGSDLDEEERISIKNSVGIERPIGDAILFFPRKDLV
ncbi:phosphodiester glycosidase family protein [Candidatus Dependentiae bacterium]|nr:phosphodiester glycosidase family protein [Candidatus Dependentiae bacterium]